MSCAFVASASAAMTDAESLCSAATRQVLLVRSAGRNPELHAAATRCRPGASREPPSRRRDFREKERNRVAAESSGLVAGDRLRFGGRERLWLDVIAR
jgi:hypothetical protein